MIERLLRVMVCHFLYCIDLIIRYNLHCEIKAWEYLVIPWAYQYSLVTAIAFGRR